MKERGKSRRRFWNFKAEFVPLPKPSLEGNGKRKEEFSFFPFFTKPTPEEKVFIGLRCVYVCVYLGSKHATHLFIGICWLLSGPPFLAMKEPYSAFSPTQRSGFCGVRFISAFFRLRNVFYLCGKNRERQRESPWTVWYFSVQKRTLTRNNPSIKIMLFVVSLRTKPHQREKFAKPEIMVVV